MLEADPIKTEPAEFDAGALINRSKNTSSHGRCTCLVNSLPSLFWSKPRLKIPIPHLFPCLLGSNPLRTRKSHVVPWTAVTVSTQVFAHQARTLLSANLVWKESSLQGTSTFQTQIELIRSAWQNLKTGFLVSWCHVLAYQLILGFERKRATSGILCFSLSSCSSCTVPLRCIGRVGSILPIDCG